MNSIDLRIQVPNGMGARMCGCIMLVGAHFKEWPITATNLRNGETADAKEPLGLSTVGSAQDGIIRFSSPMPEYQWGMYVALLEALVYERDSAHHGVNSFSATSDCLLQTKKDGLRPDEALLELEHATRRARYDGFPCFSRDLRVRTINYSFPNRFKPTRILPRQREGIVLNARQLSLGDFECRTGRGRERLAIQEIKDVEKNRALFDQDMIDLVNTWVSLIGLVDSGNSNPLDKIEVRRVLAKVLQERNYTLLAGYVPAQEFRMLSFATDIIEQARAIAYPLYIINGKGYLVPVGSLLDVLSASLFPNAPCLVLAAGVNRTAHKAVEQLMKAIEMGHD